MVIILGLFWWCMTYAIRREVNMSEYEAARYPDKARNVQFGGFAMEDEDLVRELRRR